MAVSSLLQALDALNAAVDVAIDDHTTSLDELACLKSSLLMTVSRINQHHNTLTPIGTLPPETLGRIFEFVVARPRDICEFRPTHSDQAKHLPSVCKSWRNIALNWPRMWYQIIDADMPESMAARFSRNIFRRSGTTPLHIFSWIPPYETPSLFLHIYRNQPHRIQEAHIGIDTDQSLGEILQSLSSPLPNLECLNLYMPHGFLEHEQNLGLPLILGGDATSLRALLLQRMPFIPGNEFPNLVDLRLNAIAWNALSIQNLLQLLRNCPRLETLDLACTEPALSSAPSDEGDPSMALVVLPNLRGLRMGYASVDHALALLSLLTLPRHPVIRLDNMSRTASPYESYAEHSIWPSLTKPPLSTLYEVKGLTQLDIVYGKDNFGITQAHFISHGEDRGIWFHVGVGRRYTSPDFGQFERLLAHVDVRDITTLRLKDLPEVAERLFFLRALLVKMPSLSRILVVDQQGLLVSLASTPVLPEWMAHVLTPTRPPDGAAAEVPAPGLHTLAIQVNSWNSKVPVDALIRLTAARKQSGHPISTLMCDMSNAAQEDLAPLTEYVSELDTANDSLGEVNADVPPVFKMKNDYWDLFRRESSMERIRLPSLWS